jgi:hypothetical protein
MRGVFATGQSQPSPSNKSLKTFKVGHSIKLQTANDLLYAKHTKELLEQVKPLSQLPDDYFVLCYKVLVKKFAAFVNVLPSSLDRGLGSLYCGSLYGAYYTLKLFIQEKPESDCLWRWAVFSAALLKQVNTPSKLYQVIVTDSEGHFKERWNPFGGSLEDIGAKFCKLYPFNHLFVHNHAILMGFCIGQVVPTEAMKWLQSNSDLLSQWLDCLQSEHDVAGVLGQALAPLKNEELTLPYEEKISVDLIETPETAPGEILDQWIREGIANGSIKINTPDSPLQIVRDSLTDALFVEKGVIRQFAQKIANSPVSMAAAVAQFYALFGPKEQRAMAFAMPGTTRPAGLGLSSQTAKSVQTGQVFDAGAYFGKDQIPAKSGYVAHATHSAKSAAKSATDSPALRDLAAIVTPAQTPPQSPIQAASKFGR